MHEPPHHVEEEHRAPAVEPSPAYSNRVSQGSWLLAAPKRALRSLEHRSFRIFTIGQALSLPGAWMQTTAQAWLVYRLTDSASLLGAVQFAANIPIVLFGLAGGLVADRYPRRTLVILTQALLMAQAAALAWLTLTDRVTVHHVIALAAFFGAVNAFDIPARQSLLSELVPPRDLMNAIALNSSNFNLARLIGPAIAGIIVARYDEGTCFLVNALSFSIVLAALFGMRSEYARPRVGERVSPLRSLGEGLLYVSSTPHVKAVLALIAVASFFAYPYVVVLPVFARDILHGDASTFGTLISAIGVGALAGALTLAYRKNVHGLGRVIAWAAACFGLSMVGFAFSRSLPLSILFCVGMGFGMMTHLAASNTLVQTYVPDRLRGRLMSIYSTVMIGFAPFGSLLAGWLTDRIGATAVAAGGGVALALGALWFSTWIPAIREKMPEESADAE